MVGGVLDFRSFQCPSWETLSTGQSTYTNRDERKFNYLKL